MVESRGRNWEIAKGGEDGLDWKARVCWVEAVTYLALFGGGVARTWWGEAW